MAIQSPTQSKETGRPGFFTPEMKEKMDAESMKNVEELKKQEEKDRVAAEVERLTKPQPTFADTTPEQPQRSPSQVGQPIVPPSVEVPEIQTQPNLMAGYDAQVQQAQAPFVSQEEEMQKKIDTQMNEVETIKNDLSKIKPQARDFFYGKSAANKVFSAIGLALASLTPEGAKNAVSIINNTIDRDLKDQEIAYNTKSKDLEESKSVYKAYMDRLQNVQAAKLAAKNDILEKLKFNLQAQAQQTNSQEAKARLAIMQKQADIEMQKNLILMQKELASTQPKANLQNLPKEKLVYYTNANDALNAVNGMEKALKAGVNTFSTVGDNDFTLNRNMFAEALGRMQSGGAIGVEEEKRFLNFAPTPFDSAQMQQKKLRMMKQILNQRINSIIGEEKLPSSARK